MENKRPNLLLALASTSIIVVGGLWCFYNLGHIFFPGVYIALLLGVLTGLFFAHKLYGGLVSGATVIMFISAIGAGVQVNDFSRYSSGRSADGISIREAPRKKQSLFFSFTDGAVAQAYTGSFTKTSYVKDATTKVDVKRETVYRVAPVLLKLNPENPDPTSVTLWVGCHSGSGDYACSDYLTGSLWKTKWGKAHRAGIRTLEANHENYQKAIKQAVQKHGLVSAPDAPVIYWMENPRERLMAKFYDNSRRSLILFGVLNLLVLLVVYYFKFMRKK